jgi:predicted transcriptional regulator
MNLFAVKEECRQFANDSRHEIFWWGIFAKRGGFYLSENARTQLMMATVVDERGGGSIGWSS